MYSFEEKSGNAPHAALDALGLVAETYPDTADLINDMLSGIARQIVTDDCEEE